MKENEYYSCNIIEHGFDAQIKSINLCCRISKDIITEKVILIDNYKGQKVDWKEFFAKKDYLRNLQKSGKTIPCCQGCIYLETKDWGNEQYINTININNWIKCNANCIYCDRNQYNHIKAYNIYPLIKDLIKNNLLKNPADITIAGGEPTITSDFDKTLKILIKNNISPVRVLTNAIKYNKHIEKGLKTGLVNILVSTDSGTPDVYKKIKSVNKHKEVWKNLKKYAKIQQHSSLVKTKYIILPDINDNEREIKEYIQRNSEAGIKFTYIDIEISRFCKNSNNKNFIQKMYDLYMFAKNTGSNLGVNVEAFDRMQIAISKINT